MVLTSNLKESNHQRCISIKFNCIRKDRSTVNHGEPREERKDCCTLSLMTQQPRISRPDRNSQHHSVMCVGASATFHFFNCCLLFSVFMFSFFVVFFFFRYSCFCHFFVFSVWNCKTCAFVRFGGSGIAKPLF